MDGWLINRRGVVWYVLHRRAEWDGVGGDG